MAASSATSATTTPSAGRWFFDFRCGALLLLRQCKSQAWADIQLRVHGLGRPWTKLQIRKQRHLLVRL